MISLVLGLLLLTASGLPAQETAGEPAVHAYFFYSNECPHCAWVIHNVLPSLRAGFPKILTIHTWEITEPANRRRMMVLEEHFDVDPFGGELPEVFIGSTVLIGATEIQKRMKEVIAEEVARGGTALPEAVKKELEASTVLPRATAEGAPSIHLTVFLQPGCKACNRTRVLLDYLKTRFLLAVSARDARVDALLLEGMARRAGVPAARRLIAPAVFVGNQALVGTEVTMENMERLLAAQEATGAPKVEQGLDDAVSRRALFERFRSFGLPAVLLAGLLDGLNPCAFATLIFFVSYLTLSGRKGREILQVGAAFTLGVFLAYLAAGLGLQRLLGALEGISEFGRWLYRITALLCAILALLSFLDFLKARGGELGAMRLKLPAWIRDRIHALIRKGRGAAWFSAAALLIGAAVSLLELACTGQVYLPTILFVLSEPALKSRASFLLVAYNLAFVFPMIVVFFLVWLGTNTQELSAFLSSRAATVKLALAALFAGLAFWMALFA